MKFTVGGLKDYLEFDYSVEELCNKLTDIGLEVEKVLDPSKNLKDFKIAKILKKSSNPNDDKLSLCEVFDGNENFSINLYLSSLLCKILTNKIIGEKIIIKFIRMLYKKYINFV